MNISTLRLLGILLLAAGCLIGQTRMVSAQDLNPAEVNGAIDGAIRYLKNTQKPNGSWDEWVGHACGASALCTLSLLSAGLTKDDPAVNRALVYLRQFSPDAINQTYTVSLQAMVFAMADPQRDLPLIQKNVEWLEKAQIKNSGTTEYNGGWDYTVNGSVPDNSNSQYAILGLYEAERAGATVRPETWQAAKAYWENAQNANGSWPYRHDSSRGTLTMTSAGIASLIMINGSLGGQAAAVHNGEILCCRPDENTNEDRITKGLSWLTKGFTSWPGTWNYYYLYGIERVGRLSADRFIGQYDWFREGTNILLQKKGPVANYWKADGSESYDHIATSFALLFLAKGRRPVLVSKGQYIDDGSWSPHPNDLHHLTQFAERNWRLEMSWQVVDIRRATVDDLLQTPVLFLCGDKSLLNGTPQQQRQLADKLRAYIDGGGFIFAEANAEDEDFDASFRQLMQNVFDDETGGYELRLLEAEHPIWTIEKPISIEHMRELWGIDYGCRTSVVYIPPHRNVRTDRVRPVPPSLSCLWELQRYHQRGEPYPEHVQTQIDAALDIGLNVLAYATGRSPRFKYDMPSTARQKLDDYAGNRGNEILVAMLDVQGNANAAPRAIPKLLAKVANDLKIPVDVRPKKITLDEDEIFDYPILFMHGRNAVELTDSQRERLKRYIENGGFLFVNAICSSKPFTESFRREMATIFPDHKMTKLAPNDPLLTDACGGFNLPTLTLRTPQRIEGRRTEVVNVPIAPELEGVSFEGHWRVLFSPYDVSCALEEMSGSLQCRGYTQDDAFNLALNAILYAVEYF